MFVCKPLVSNRPLPYPLLLWFRYYHATCRLVSGPTYQRVFTSAPNQVPHGPCMLLVSLEIACRERASQS